MDRLTRNSAQVIWPASAIPCSAVRGRMGLGSMERQLDRRNGARAPDSRHENQQVLAVESVDDPMVPDMEPADPLPLRDQLLALERVMPKSLDRSQDSALFLAWQSGQLLDRSPLPPNRG